MGSRRLRARLRLGTRAVALRLALPRLVAAQSLPTLLETLTRGAVEPAPLDLVDEALARAESIAERLPFVPDTCLYRSLARFSLLRRAGWPARFVMAIDPPAGPASDLEGHAWVELEGAPYGEALDDRLVVTYAYPEDPAPSRP